MLINIIDKNYNFKIGIHSHLTLNNKEYFTKLTPFVLRYKNISVFNINYFNKKCVGIKLAANAKLYFTYI